MAKRTSKRGRDAAGVHGDPGHGDDLEPGRDFLAGKLLIAMPSMEDPRFRRSVVLMCLHDPEQAMGVIVNKPLANVEFGDLLEQLSIDPRAGVGGETVYCGGPVQTDRGLVIHSLDYRRETTLTIAPGVGLTATREVLNDIAGQRPERTPPARYLLAVGHAGWGPGQLESELALNAWAHCDVYEDLVFNPNPGRTWRSALQTLGVTAAMFSTAWSTVRSDDEPLQ